MVRHSESLAGGVRTALSDLSLASRTAPEKPKGRAKRKREARGVLGFADRDAELWALRKMGYFKIGQPHSMEVPSRRSI